MRTEELAARLLHQLKEQGRTLATAESCTGGGIGHMLTAIPGSSAVYLGGVISYTNGVKAGLLHVPQELLNTVGAVSPETAEAMAACERPSVRTLESASPVWPARIPTAAESRWVWSMWRPVTAGPPWSGNMYFPAAVRMSGTRPSGKPCALPWSWRNKNLGPVAK